MQSRMILPRCRIHSSQSLRSIGYATACVLGGVGFAASSAHAVPALAHSPHLYLNQGDLIERIVVVRRGRAAVGPRGGATINCGSSRCSAGASGGQTGSLVASWLVQVPAGWRDRKRVQPSVS